MRPDGIGCPNAQRQLRDTSIMSFSIVTVIHNDSIAQPISPQRVTSLTKCSQERVMHGSEKIVCSFLDKLLYILLTHSLAYIIMRMKENKNAIAFYILYYLYNTGILPCDINLYSTSNTLVVLYPKGCKCAT
jgi:hypothetical protein